MAACTHTHEYLLSPHSWALQGMPHKVYHGRTGVVWNVTKRSVGVEVNKQVQTIITYQAQWSSDVQPLCDDSTSQWPLGQSSMFAAVYFILHLAWSIYMSTTAEASATPAFWGQCPGLYETQAASVSRAWREA